MKFQSEEYFEMVLKPFEERGEMYYSPKISYGDGRGYSPYQATDFKGWFKDYVEAINYMSAHGCKMIKIFRNEAQEENFVAYSYNILFQNEEFVK